MCARGASMESTRRRHSVQHDRGVQQQRARARTVGQAHVGPDGVQDVAVRHVGRHAVLELRARQGAAGAAGRSRRSIDVGRCVAAAAGAGCSKCSRHERPRQQGWQPADRARHRCRLRRALHQRQRHGVFGNAGIGRPAAVCSARPRAHGGGAHPGDAGRAAPPARRPRTRRCRARARAPPARPPPHALGRCASGSMPAICDSRRSTSMKAATSAPRSASGTAAARARRCLQARAAHAHHRAGTWGAAHGQGAGCEGLPTVHQLWLPAAHL